jgi:hypothetical protein
VATGAAATTVANHQDPEHFNILGWMESTPLLYWQTGDAQDYILGHLPNKVGFVL